VILVELVPLFLGGDSDAENASVVVLVLICGLGYIEAMLGVGTQVGRVATLCPPDAARS
jgi:hypothetical protein